MAQAFKQAMSNIANKPKPTCNHEWVKTIGKSGMHFILFCFKCGNSRGYSESIGDPNES